MDRSWIFEQASQAVDEFNCSLMSDNKLEFNLTVAVQSGMSNGSVCALACNVDITAQSNSHCVATSG